MTLTGDQSPPGRAILSRLTDALAGRRRGKENRGRPVSTPGLRLQGDIDVGSATWTFARVRICAALSCGVRADEALLGCSMASEARHLESKTLRE
jgi:hypothetical protein